MCVLMRRLRTRWEYVFLDGLHLTMIQIYMHTLYITASSVQPNPSSAVAMLLDTTSSGLPHMHNSLHVAADMLYLRVQCEFKVLRH